MSSPHPQTIAIIDDDDVVRDSLRAVLEAHRFAVVEFSSAREFLTQCSAAKPACLIIDIEMSEMTGLDLLSSLRAAGDHTPALLVSGRHSPTIRARAAALKTPLLDKPIARGTLFAAIEQVLAKPDLRLI
jgi:FixJ family two-component response regulator